MVQIRNCIHAIKDCDKLLSIASHSEIRSILLSIRKAYYGLLRAYYIDIGLKSKQADAIVTNIKFVFDVLKPYHKNGCVFSTKETYYGMLAWHIYSQGKGGFNE